VIQKTLIAFGRTLRPHQWAKNIFVFAPVVFSLRFFKFEYLGHSFLAFLLFSLVAGSIYVLNDCFDREMDRLHPTKCKRPIASGALGVKTAAIMGSILLALTLAAIYEMDVDFFRIALFYVLMNVVYSVFLKKVVILDVMIIAIGFVLRVQIGGVINQIELSPWILIITFLLAIFLALIKRRQELVKVNGLENNGSASTQEGGQTRQTLKQYNLSLLDQLISITTATTLISYIVYVVNPDILHKFHTTKLYLTVPFVIFGIFRYLYLTYVKGEGENPAEVLFSDLSFTVNGILWVVVFIIVILYVN